MGRIVSVSATAFAAAASVVVASLHAATATAFVPTADNLLQECFCMNATGGSVCSNGINFDNDFNSPACGRFLEKTLGWTVPTMLLYTVLALFPLVFAVGRVCCNCFGTRDPSYGFCCRNSEDRRLAAAAALASTNSAAAVALLGGNAVQATVLPVRSYSRRTVAITKLAMYTLFLLYAAWGIPKVLQASQDLHHRIGQVGDNVVTSCRQTLSVVTQSVAAVQKLANASNTVGPLMNLSAVARGNSLLSTVEDLATQITNTVQDVESYDGGSHSNLGWGNRVRQTAVVACSPIFLMFLLACCALANGRGCFVTVISCLLSWVASLVVLVFFVFMVIAIAVTGVDRSYWSAVIPALTTYANNHGCWGLADDGAAIREAVRGFSAGVCGAGVCELASSFGFQGTVPSACGCAGASHSGSVGATTLPSMEEFNQMWGMGTFSSCPRGQHCTLWNCARSVQYCPSAEAHAVAVGIAAWVTPYMESLQYLAYNALPMTTNCGIVTSSLAGVGNFGRLSALAGAASDTAYYMMWCMLIASATVPVGILGAKRFQQSWLFRRSRAALPTTPDNVATPAMPAGCVAGVVVRSEACAPALGGTASGYGATDGCVVAVPPTKEAA